LSKSSSRGWSLRVGITGLMWCRRNVIERVVGWFKWCRALATRYDKLAVNYVAMWLVANIQYLLRNYLEALGP
jgi:transposase